MVGFLAVGLEAEVGASFVAGALVGASLEGVLVVEGLDVAVDDGVDEGGKTVLGRGFFGAGALGGNCVGNRVLGRGFLTGIGLGLA